MNREILKVVYGYIDAIHTQDVASFKGLWSKEQECRLISIARVFSGIGSICQDFLIDGIRAAYSSIELIADKVDVSEINESLAIVTFSYHTDCIRRDSGERYGISGIETQALIKEHGEWKLVHVHYSKAD